MYQPLRRLVLRLLVAPTEPPEPPAGSPDSVKVFRASPRFLTLQLLRVGVVALITLITLVTVTWIAQRVRAGARASSSSNATRAWG